MTPKSDQCYSIAIVGAGFSGAMLAYHLIQKARSPLDIYLIEKTGSFAKGPAYSTLESCHLLNVRAEQMGAIAGDPNHFYRWVVENEFTWRDSDPSFKTLKISPQSFLPRKLYAIYLNALLQQSIRDAKEKDIQLQLISKEAVDAAITPLGKIAVHLGDGSSITAGTLVLATGLCPTKQFEFSPEDLTVQQRYISNIWERNGANIPINLTETSHVAIIGTGLTMVDACMTLFQKGYQGKITALSSHGKLSESHKESLSAYPLSFNPDIAPLSALKLFSRFHQELKKATAAGHDWRAVVDALRPVTVSLWEQLSLLERKRFLRLLSSGWNRHRHRVPPNCYDILREKMTDGTLDILAGKVKAVEAGDPKRLIVVYQLRGSGSQKTLKADWVLNCTGHDMNIAKSGGPLVTTLIANDYIQVDGLGMGLKLVNTWDLPGRGRGKIFALGLLLFGEKFETIAVPELREQALALADHILRK